MSDVTILSKVLLKDDDGNPIYTVRWDYGDRIGWTGIPVTQEMVDDTNLDLEKQWFIPIIESYIELDRNE